MSSTDEELDPGPAGSPSKAHQVATRPLLIAIVVVLVVAIVGGVWLIQGSRGGGKNSAKDLMANVQVAPVGTVAANPQTGARVADFGTSLLRLVASGNDNYLVSPLSLELALAMTANGAGGQTQAQMLQALSGGASMDQLNAFLYDYVAGLPSSDTAKVNIANSIWYDESRGIDVEQSFLQTNATWFGAGAFQAPFSGQTIKDMNACVSQNTDGMIQDMVDSLDPSAVMVLLNALALDANWAQPYESPQVSQGTFTSADGKQQQADFMASTEAQFLDDGLATGFIKPYDQDAYEFVALLPNEGVSMSDYIASLTGAGLLNTLQFASEESVVAQLPQFSFADSLDLVDTLKAMGMTDAFQAGAADFSNMASNAAQLQLYVGDVKQKTFIDVTPSGTRAGAATQVDILAGNGYLPPPHEVTLDRPFVFAIVDGASHLPLFLGVVNSIG